MKALKRISKMEKKNSCSAGVHERAVKGFGLFNGNLGRSLMCGLIVLGLIFGLSGSVSAEILYEFTNCGQTGPYGPSQAQCDSAYAGTTLDGVVTVNGGIQQWTVPSSGTYRIEAFGAKGGSSYGGSGARISGDFNLTAGTTLKILVGQMGSSAPNYYSWGGGGGTFVVKSDDIPLIIGGGGGGGFQHFMGSWKWGGPGRIEESGGPDGNGGQSGNGGQEHPYYPWGPYGSGGGGFYTDGEGNGGKAFLNGGYGSTTRNNGGFGGGGGTSNNGYNVGGGGGGYSGGNAGIFDSYFQGILYPSSGGGGSYNSGSNQDNTAGANNGHGKLIISIVVPIPAFVDIGPDTLNLKSKGKWITCYIELAEGYDVADIDATTVYLEGVIPAETDPKYDFVTDPADYLTDKDDDGILERMVKFGGEAVRTLLTGQLGDVTLTVTGEVGGTPFEGSDAIRVIDKGGGR